MACLNLYVLTSLSIEANGNVVSRNVGVTFALFDAEAHRDRGVENDFETHVADSNWSEDAAESRLVTTMRDFCAIVRQMQDEALR